MKRRTSVKATSDKKGFNLFMLINIILALHKRIRVAFYRIRVALPYRATFYLISVTLPCRATTWALLQITSTI